MIYIRSVGRAEKVNITLNMFKRLNTKLPIFILVRKSEEEEYKYLEKDENLNIKILVNPYGADIKGQNKYVSELDGYIALCDDDIVDISLVKNKKEKLAFNFDNFFEEQVELMKRENCHLLSMENSGNPYFTANKIQKGLYFFSGFVIMKCEKYLGRCNFVHFEDSEKALLSFRKGHLIIKNRNYCIKHKIMVKTQKGGYSEFKDRAKLRTMEIDDITEEFSDLVIRKKDKKFLTEENEDIKPNKTVQNRFRQTIL